MLAIPAVPLEEQKDPCPTSSWRLGPDAAALSVDQPASDGQAQPSSPPRTVPRLVGSPERLEDAFAFFFGNTWARSSMDAKTAPAPLPAWH